ncbi:MAG: GGDEF domain-containing protein [Anaerolineaceae bacterium]|nr:GGDEF domain-containing protein [Anaerolineaceae bacterium]
MDQDTSSSRIFLYQDLGIFLFIAAVVAAALITALAGESLLYQHVALMTGIAIASLLIGLRARIGGIVVSGVAIVAFAIYKLYFRFAYNVPIEWTAFVWPFVIVLAITGMMAFVSYFSQIEGVNGLLNIRLDQLTVMDPLTGLENNRSMVSSLSRYMALSERKGTEMGLMMIRLRYAEELKKVLTTIQFNELRHNLAITVQDVIRMEDRVFSIDDNGSLGIIYFSTGASFLKGRILTAVNNKNMLPDLNQQLLTVDLSIVYKQYDKELGKDAMRFITEVEKEFAYEV